MKKTTFARRTSLWLTLMAITCAPLAAQTGPGFGSLKCEQETDPVGIETPSPRFSWQLVSPERGCRQTAYRIVVAGTERTPLPAVLRCGTAARFPANSRC